MNLIVCNSCGGENDVRTVRVTAARLTETELPGLARRDHRRFDGDLCDTCLNMIGRMLDPEEQKPALVKAG